MKDVYDRAQVAMENLRRARRGEKPLPLSNSEQTESKQDSTDATQGPYTNDPYTGGVSGRSPLNWSDFDAIFGRNKRHK